MLNYIIKRLLQLIPIWIAITIIVFILIQLPPGDYLTTMAQNFQKQGTTLSDDFLKNLATQYHMGEPLYKQYIYWMNGILFHGDLGVSFVWDKPVTEVIGDRMAMTIMISLMSLLIIWLIAIPIGIYSAVKQYSFFDYFFMFIAFIGVSIPGFLIALFIIYQLYKATGFLVIGLFSTEFISAPWNLAKLADMMKHVWFPIMLIAINGTGGMMRMVRGLMLDELGKQYVITGRAKGLTERRLLLKYPVRLAFNPIISTIGWMLPGIITGEALISIILNLQTMGPVMLSALLNQDMYLAASFLLITSTLTIIGTLVSDILLVTVDPRIKFGRGGAD